LAHVLRHLPQPSHPDLLVGTATGDDAAVWRVADDRALVATVDVFTPIVDDPRSWGAIAAANAASDVYAMGGTPTFSLNIAGWPRNELSLDLLSEVLLGAAEVAEVGKWLIIGGHTIDSTEPFYGQSVIGEVHPDRIIGNDGARPGDVVMLTKPIGTGLVTTASKRASTQDVAPGGWLHEAHAAAVANMRRLNNDAAAVARTHQLRGGTDITGFGLLGHLHRVAAASNVTITVTSLQVPTLPGVDELLRRGAVPGGTQRNLDYVQPHVRFASGIDPLMMNLLADPQTSGGLALCVPAAKVDDVTWALVEHGLSAAIIGEVGVAIESSPHTTLFVE
jgi:selenide, water dikinase